MNGPKTNWWIYTLINCQSDIIIFAKCIISILVGDSVSYIMKRIRNNIDSENKTWENITKSRDERDWLVFLLLF